MARKVKPLEDVRALLRGTFADVEVIARSKAARTALLRTLRDAEAALAKRLVAEANRYGGPTARFSGASAAAYQAQVQLAVRYVEKRLAGLTEAQATKAIAQSLGRTVTLMGNLEKRFTGVSRPIPLAATAELRATGHKSKGVWLRDFPSSVSRYGTKMIGEFEEVIRRGLLTGRTNDEMVRALVKHGGPDGLFVQHKYWAERIVRTETMRAYNGARQHGFERMEKDDPKLQKKILAILDKRTAPDSQAVHGQVRKVGELFMDGAGRQYLYPPARPNDRETTIPWKVAWDDQAENDLGDYERAVLGELTKEEEDELIRRLQGDDKRKTRKRKPKPPDPPPPEPEPPPPPPPEPKPVPKAEPKLAAPPLQAPIPAPKVTNHERLAQSYVDDTGWRPDGPNVEAYVGGKKKGAAIWYQGKWRADWYEGVNIQFGSVQHDTVEAAMDELRGMITIEARAAARLTAEVSDYDGITNAMAADDGKASRMHARALLRDHGVLPRDPIRDMAPSLRTDSSVSPGAEATHHWDGSVGIKPGVLPSYAKMKSATEGMEVVIHEELHGCTPYKNPWFYIDAGAAIEECTVEMAARKVTASVLAKKFPSMSKAVSTTWGAYQSTINQLGTIIKQEAGTKLLGETFELIADAGIKMRAPGALELIGGGKGLETQEDIVDLFLACLDVKDQSKPTIRRRILAELRL